MEDWSLKREAEANMREFLSSFTAPRHRTHCNALLACLVAAAQTARNKIGVIGSKHHNITQSPAHQCGYTFRSFIDHLHTNIFQ